MICFQYWVGVSWVFVVIVDSAVVASPPPPFPTNYFQFILAEDMIIGAVLQMVGPSAIHHK